MSAPETARQVKRRRQRIGSKLTDPSGGHEIETRLRLHPLLDSDGLREMLELSAAAHADVLTGIDELAGGGIGERTCPATQAVARLKKRDLKSLGRQCRRGRQTRRTYANDNVENAHF